MRGLDPILVTSPSVRCGTTLLQRLLCSSANALVYGEEIGKDLEIQLQLDTSRRLIHAHGRQRFASSLDRVVRGDSNDWIVDLMPDLDDYLDAMREAAFAGLASCRRNAQAAGRSLWGFKYPGWSPQVIRMLADNLPATRVIYIHRDLDATARSAKAWHGFQHPSQMQAFCAQWVEHMRFMQQWRQDHEVLVLSYESLVADPQAAIAQLCGFLPFERIDAGLLGRRINNGTEAAASPHGHNVYIEPAALTPQEQACVDDAKAAVAW